MTYVSGAAVGAIAATAAARRRMLEEEEQMTHYSDDELQNDWEFKIVRANREVFGNPNELKKLLGQEEQAGWILLEKLDNSRVRFKRRRSAQANDAQLIASGIDPYRSHYGMSPSAFVLLIALLGLAILFGIVAIMIIFMIRATSY